jgi:hypothetical protein
MREQTHRTAPLLRPRGDQQALPSVIQHADIAGATLHLSRLFAPTGREFSLAFLGDGQGIERLHAAIIHHFIPRFKRFQIRGKFQNPKFKSQESAPVRRNLHLKVEF